VAHDDGSNEGAAFDAWVAEATRIGELHRVVVLEGDVRLDEAARLARAVVPEHPPLVLAIPGIDELAVLEESAALVAQASGAAVAPREDVAGVVDAAAEALRATNVRALVLLDADPLLRVGGPEVLNRWAESSDATLFVVADEVPESLAASRVQATRTSADDARRALEEPENLDLLLQLSLLPTRLPMRALCWTTGLDGGHLGRGLEALRRRGLVRYTIAALEIVAELPAAVRRAVLERHPHSASLRAAAMGRLAERLAEGACVGPKRLSEATFLANHRALVRHVLAWARSAGHPARAALSVALLDAMGPVGSMQTSLSVADTALDEVADRETRLALETRRASLERAVGRSGPAAARLVAAVADVAGVSTSARAEAAITLARLSTPEGDMSAARRRAKELVDELVRADPTWAAVAARVRMLRFWAEGDAYQALVAGIEAHARSEDEVTRLDLLASTTANAVGAGEVTLACELATSYEAEGARAGRADFVARARGFRGCALVDAGQTIAGIDDLTAAIDRLASSGFRQYERWHRLHRGLAHALRGDVERALRDYEDFGELSRMIGAPSELAILAAAATGSVPARTAVPSLRGLHPCFLPIVAHLAGDAAEVAALDGAPGFFALEVRLLERLLRAGSTRPALPARAGSPETRSLVVGEDDAWFSYDGREVSLKKMHTLRRVFGGLVSAYAKGAALGVDEIFSVGWPGERVAASSMTNRVYVTMCRLRGLGLKDAIVYGDAGWSIATGVRVLRSRRAEGVACATGSSRSPSQSSPGSPRWPLHRAISARSTRSTSTRRSPSWGALGRSGRALRSTRSTGRWDPPRCRSGRWSRWATLSATRPSRRCSSTGARRSRRRWVRAALPPSTLRGCRTRRARPRPT
jgi:hypothetical protein